jgi:1-acyl-sn-glycerol-3-phosphate acyltransferase
MRTIARTFLVGRFHIEGLEHVPRRGGLLVCPNHRSTIDPPLVPAFLPRADSWSMAKSDYFEKGGLTTWVFTRYHAFPVVRHTADRRAVRRAFEILQGGHALILYPEGTRVESGGLQVPEPGAGFLAQGTDAPVLPVALTGTRECFPKGARWPRRVPVRICFGRPFRLPRKDAAGRRIPAQDAAAAVMLSIAELLPEDLRGAFSDLDAWRAKVGGLRIYGADRDPSGLPSAGHLPDKRGGPSGRPA